MAITFLRSTTANSNKKYPIRITAKSNRLCEIGEIELCLLRAYLALNCRKYTHQTICLHFCRINSTATNWKSFNFIKVHTISLGDIEYFCDKYFIISAFLIIKTEKKCVHISHFDGNMLRQTRHTKVGKYGFYPTKGANCRRCNK